MSVKTKWLTILSAMIPKLRSENLLTVSFGINKQKSVWVNFIINIAREPAFVIRPMCLAADWKDCAFIDWKVYVALVFILNNLDFKFASLTVRPLSLTFPVSDTDLLQRPQRKFKSMYLVDYHLSRELKFQYFSQAILNLNRTNVM